MTLDELLLEWSYRSEKGYPDLDNPSDISILKQILEKLNLPSNTIIKNLKELKSLVAEEYNKFVAEQEDDKKDDAPKNDAPKDDKPKDDKPKAAKKPKVDVGGGDLDIKGDENPEETLKAIYDMLKDFFEGDKDKGDDKAPEMPDMPEIPTMDGAPDMGMLQERFKKLANIIK